MRAYFLRVSKLWPVFAAICWGPLLLLVLLRYIFEIRFKVFALDENIWEVVLAIIIPLPGLIFVFLPAIRKFKFQERTRNGAFAFFLFAWVTSGLMITASQGYLTTYFAELRAVSTVDDIVKYPPARYYKIKDFKMGTYAGAQVLDVSLSTRKRFTRSINLNIYMVVPILGNQTADKVSCFYAVNFSKRIKFSNGTEVDRFKIGAAFRAESEKRILNYPFQQVDHFEYTPNAVNESRYRKAVERGYSVGNKRVLVLRPVLDSYAERTSIYMPGMLIAFILGSFIMCLCLISARAEDAYTKLDNVE